MSAGAASGLYIVLTMRGIAESKERLAGAISKDERARLNRGLLERTLGVVSEWLVAMERCVFVSPCEEALKTAGRAGATLLAEPEGARGHNHAAAVGSSRAIELGAKKIMMLPCDLPYLTGDALDTYVAHSPSARLVLAPDKDGTGTNSVLVDADADLRFFFGEGSLGRYFQWGLARGWRVASHAAPPLAFDIDTPADYALWMRDKDGRGRNRPGAIFEP